MLKSCIYCGKVHDSRYKCSKRPVYNKRTDEDRFRSTKAWRLKREEIRQRDKQLCQVCIRKLHNTINQYTYNDLSVHHAIPLSVDFDRRLDNDNLITLCSYHHEEAEKKAIDLETILEIIQEQEVNG